MGMKSFDCENKHCNTSSFPEHLRYVRQHNPPSSIIGQAYMQGGRLGFASYHFDSTDDCYISYEAAPESWRMDDGSRPPARKAFDNPSWNEETRTFTGTIDWSAGTFGGDARWEYEMIFSDDLSTISGGMVHAFDAEGSPTHTQTFGRNLQYALYVEEIAQLLHI